MKSSIFLTTASAAWALAGPVNKRMVVYETVTDLTIVTVTGDAPVAVDTSAARPVYMNGDGRKNRPNDNVVASSQPAVVIVTQTVQAGSQPTSTIVQDQQPVVTVVETYSPSPASSTVEEAVPSSSTPTAKEAAPTTTATTLEGAAIAAHNVHRSNHSAPALEWDAELAQYAANTAASCVFAHDMTQGSGGYGQNIAMWASTDNPEALGEVAAINMATHDMWYNGEVNKFLPSYYKEPTPDMSNFEAWGHFSQLVWKGSEDLGCHVQLCPKGTMATDMEAWYMVCNYKPAGNVGGAYGDNVLTSNGAGTVAA